MFDPKTIDIQYDADNSIMYLNLIEKYVFNDPDEFKAYVKCVYSIYDRLAGGKRFYLIIDLQNLVVDQSLLKEYKEMITFMYGHYLYQNGVARFGSQLTRLTIKMGHTEQQDHQPNIFPTKAEAVQFIHALIKKNTQNMVKTMKVPLT